MRLKSPLTACVATLMLAGCTIPDGVLNSLLAAQAGKANGNATADKGANGKDKQPPMNGDRPADGQAQNTMGPGAMIAPMAPVDPKTVFMRFDANNSGTWSLDEFRKFAMCPMPGQPPVGGNPPPQPPTDGGTQPPQNTSTTTVNTTVSANAAPSLSVLQAGATVGATGSGTATTQPMPGTVMPQPPMPQPVCDPTKTEGAFKEFDRDGNGQLSTEEAFVAIQKRMPQPPTPSQPPTRTGSCDEEFAKYDANRDKRVAWEEFYRPAPDMDPAAESKYKEKFTSLDRNQDGFLDPAEYCGTNAVPPTTQPDPMPTPDCETRVKAYDPDADGKISFNDYADARYAELRFVKEPTDDEIRKMKETFLVDAKKLDTNGDGTLDYAELSLNCK